MLPIPDHSYSAADTSTSPSKQSLKRKISAVENKLASTRKKVKVLLQSKRRLVRRNANLSSVIAELEKQKLMGADSLAVLEKSAGGVKDLILRHIKKQQHNTLPTCYSPELRTFALTLHFYSPHAYRYVRKVFNTCLPHPRTIERWYSSIDGRPGFTEAAFCALQARTAANPKPLYCALLMDEMAIRQKVEYDGRQYRGYIDLGTGLDDDSLPVAKEALTFMIVAFNDNFKLPVGYFLVDGLGAVERANVVNQCLSKLFSVGINVCSLTFDGAASNLAMASKLGCSFDSNNFKTSFSHPVSKEPVVIFLDPCHMLKLVRNTIADKKSLVDDNNEFVNFEYFERLHKLQESEGLHLGNKLRASHMAWFKKKMNVKLAAQLLSESVATSLEFCLKENIPGFEGCSATINFVRLINDLFDMFNSRNLHAYGFKRPLQVSNYKEYYNFLKTARSYLTNLKESVNGKLMTDSNRKTGFLGFVICIDSLLLLYRLLVSSGTTGMSFICTYKFSQDHIELFFGKIRSLFGFNNNPSVTQFCSAYRKLLVHNQVSDVLKGNCVPVERVPILTVSSSCPVSVLHANTPSVVVLNDSSTRSRLLDVDDNSCCSDHDYVYVPKQAHLSRCSEKIVAYIAGFVVFKLKNLIQCEDCISSLSDCTGCNTSLHSLIDLKSKGGLICPSDDVVDVCLTCEKLFRKNVFDTDGSSLSKVTAHQIVQSVLKVSMHRSVFKTLTNHAYDCDPSANHMLLLIKAIAEKYLQVRYYYAGRQFTARLHEKRAKISRQVYTKLILFSGQ